MTRVLDLDLDAFLEGVAHHREPGAGRLSEDGCQPMPVDEVLAYLRDEVGLTGPLPGRVFEYHGDIFGHWRDAIAEGALPTPFHLAHFDAHGDFDLGDRGYVQLLTEVMHRPVSERCFLDIDREHLDGSFMPFAVACRWIADIDYVYCPGGGNDINPYFRAGFDPHVDLIQLVPLTQADINQLVYGPPHERPVFRSDEPRVPLRQVPLRDYRASGPFDRIYLTRSPAFTPASADALFDAIRETFIDENAAA